jgi:hypothetical protein
VNGAPFLLRQIMFQKVLVQMVEDICDSARETSKLRLKIAKVFFEKLFDFRRGNHLERRFR